MALRYIIETKLAHEKTWIACRYMGDFATRKEAEKAAYDRGLGCDGSVRIVPVDEPTDEELASERADRMADLAGDVDWA